MNIDEGYKRLSVVLALLSGPLWFLYMLVENDWRAPRRSEMEEIVLAIVAICFLAWFLLWLGRKAYVWIAEGFRQPIN